jgi:hypothetical protein
MHRLFLALWTRGFGTSLQQVFVLVGKARMKAKSDSGLAPSLSPARRQIRRTKSINPKVRKRYLGFFNHPPFRGRAAISRVTGNGF